MCWANDNIYTKAGHDVLRACTAASRKTTPRDPQSDYFSAKPPTPDPKRGNFATDPHVAGGIMPSGFSSDPEPGADIAEYTIDDLSG